MGQVARLLLAQPFRKWGAVAVAAGLSAAMGLPLQAVEARTPAADLPSVQLSALPPEAQATERLIRAGGPFPYAKDGAAFGNRERLLPRKARGYYREYTVKTPEGRNRGARRIVCGGEPPTRPEICYYTDDHYASFRRIVQ